MLKVGLVGAGGIGSVHLDVYKRLSGSLSLSIADKNMDRIVSQLENCDTKVYACMDDMLENEELDLVDICTPTPFHTEQSIKALERGIHVLCEKPVALNVCSIDRTREVADKNGVFIMPAQVIRFWPQYMYLKDVYCDERFGKLRHILFSRLGRMPEQGHWMNDYSISGGALFDLHIHDADFIIYMFGKPVSVKSFGKNDDGCIDYITTHYEYKNMSVEAECEWLNAPIPFSMSYRAVFEKAVLIYSNERVMLYETGKAESEISFENTNVSHNGSNINIIDGYFNEINYFIKCIQSGKAPDVVTIEDSRQCISMLCKEKESLISNNVVKL